MAAEGQTEVWTEIEAMLLTADHLTVATWTLECARRVQSIAERAAPRDVGVARALRHLEQWIADQDEREADRHAAIVGAHATALAMLDRSGARAAARAAAQAAATTQNKEHAIGVAMYVCFAVRDAAVPGGDLDLPGAAYEAIRMRDRLAELIAEAGPG